MRTIAIGLLVAGIAAGPVAGLTLAPAGAPASSSASQQVSAPPDTTLRELPGYAFPVRHSTSLEATARVMADRVASVLDLFGPRLAIRPEVVLLVLGPDDWAEYTSFPVYGMPHILGGRTLIVAGEDNAFWRRQVPDPASLPDDAAAAVRRVYAGGSGEVSAAAFFDLLAIHELGHAFNGQAGVRTQRRWLGEFLPNLMLHAWVEEAAPDLLPRLTLLPDLVVAAGPGNHPYTTLAELEEHYGRIAREHPENYGWYQLRWHQGARRVYEAAGAQVLERLWAALRDHPDPLDDDAFLALLDRVDQSLGDFVRNWDAETRSPPPFRRAGDVDL
jgi:hypothetical protein